MWQNGMLSVIFCFEFALYNAIFGRFLFSPKSFIWFKIWQPFQLTNCFNDFAYWIPRQRYDLNCGGKSTIYAVVTGHISQKRNTKVFLNGSPTLYIAAVSQDSNPCSHWQFKWHFLKKCISNSNLFFFLQSDQPKITWHLIFQATDG